MPFWIFQFISTSCKASVKKYFNLIARLYDMKNVVIVIKQKVVFSAINFVANTGQVVQCRSVMLFSTAWRESKQRGIENKLRHGSKTQRAIFKATCCFTQKKGMLLEFRPTNHSKEKLSKLKTIQYCEGKVGYHVFDGIKWYFGQ